MSADDPRKEPIRHVRRPDLPWRQADMTICGRPVDRYPSERVISVAHAAAMVKDLGKQRASLFLCQTCSSRYDDRSWPEWDDDPATRLGRELEGIRWRLSDGDEHARSIERDLRALGILAESHRDEFDRLVADQEAGGLVSMADLRRQRQGRR